MNIHSVFNIVVKKFFLLSFERDARTAVRIRMNDTQTHAFPSDPAGYQPQQGLTKREYFAALAMQSLIHTTYKLEFREKFPNADAQEIEQALAEASVLQAEALLLALNKQTDQ